MLINKRCALIKVFIVVCLATAGTMQAIVELEEILKRQPAKGWMDYSWSDHKRALKKYIPAKLVRFGIPVGAIVLSRSLLVNHPYIKDTMLVVGGAWLALSTIGDLLCARSYDELLKHPYVGADRPLFHK
ncbi:MAG TPA: hypothetical protein VLG71_03570 [Candidatus Limnocylindria bacterium]|nr:hypothetical protein [Candidatus Limnocylindria bacterium]